MAELRTVDASIDAGSQFNGTEFNVSSSRGTRVLLFYEVDIQMGNESKSWSIRKVFNNEANRFVTILQSIDPTTGDPADSTADSVIASGNDINVIVDSGEQIQIVTTNATSAMYAKLYFIEIEIAQIAQSR